MNEKVKPTDKHGRNGMEREMFVSSWNLIRVSALHVGCQYKFGQHQPVVLVTSNTVHTNSVH